MASFEAARPAKSDVMISYHPSDIRLVNRMIPHLTVNGFSVWQVDVDPNLAQDVGKRGKAVIDCKVFLMVVSQASLNHAPCKDEAALAYISCKPIIPLGVESYQSMEPLLDAGMRMLLAKLNWTFFIEESDWDRRLEEMTTSVGDVMAPPAVFDPGLEGRDLFDSETGEYERDLSLTEENEFQVEYQSLAESKQKLLVSLRRNHSVQQSDLLQGTFQGLDFWDIHFSERDSVRTSELVNAFIQVYGDRLGKHVGELLRQREERKKREKSCSPYFYTPSPSPSSYPSSPREEEDKEEEKQSTKALVEDWLRQLLTKDLFGQAESIERGTYDSICVTRHHHHRDSIQDKSPSANDNFYRRVKEFSVGKLAMLNVFNMDSSVRLVAIQNLGLYQTPEIVAGLVELLNDADPNIRTVATLALGRCKSSPEVITLHRIVAHLLKRISDADRLVRQAACISLGHIRAGEAVNDLVRVWRNEPISDVRNAAFAALERMEGEDARVAIDMTRKLEEEVRGLQGPISTS